MYFVKNIFFKSSHNRSRRPHDSYRLLRYTQIPTSVLYVKHICDVFCFNRVLNAGSPLHLTVVITQCRHMNHTRICD